jgi:hypothetical protein
MYSYSLRLVGRHRNRCGEPFQRLQSGHFIDTHGVGIHLKMQIWSGPSPLADYF